MKLRKTAEELRTELDEAIDRNGGTVSTDDLSPELRAYIERTLEAARANVPRTLQ